MPIPIGTQLGTHEITAMLGKGGMGEVYRARDTKLKREVAIKVLPDELGGNQDRISRFQREAEVLASLNHPAIAAIYDVAESKGTRYLVLELVEGETLADRLTRGPIPVQEALGIGRQICEALEAAHEKGVVHRDLKPANIKVAHDGTVKVLDFGLAKAMEAAPAAGSIANSPTMLHSLAATNAGMIVGTAAYMSPEQARGSAADPRSDVFSFGCVLFEMLSGREAFHGESISDILASVLKSEPDLSLLPPDVHPRVRSLIRRALEKNPKRRWYAAGDMRIEIEEALAGTPVAGNPATAAPVTAAARHPRIHWILAAVLTLAAAMLAAAIYLRPSPPSPELRLDVTTPATNDPLGFAISPDASKLVFSANYENQARLWLRSLDSTAAQPLAGTEGANYPFWSPDSRAIAFFANGQLKRISVPDGALQTLAPALAGRGGAWSKDNVIVFAPTNGSALYRISAAGGEPVPVTKIDPPRQSTHRYPQFLPDGQHFLFFSQGTSESRGIYIGSLDQSGSQRLFDSDAAAVFSPPEHLLFVRQGTLFAQRFDLQTLAAAGEPFAAAQSVAFDGGFNLGAISASGAGVLAYRSGSAGGIRQLAWFDRTGKAIGTAGEPDALVPENPELSRDGRQVALDRVLGGARDIFLLETLRGVLNRLTSDPSADNFPIWSPDGSRIAFSSMRSGNYEIYEKSANGAGSEKPLLQSSQAEKRLVDWSPDGRHLLYRTLDPKTGLDLWALPASGDNKPFPVVNTAFQDREGQFSPDGRWIAYQSDPSQRFEIYVQPFPDAGGTFLVSTNGGAQPRWRKDGKELFYVALDGKLMAAPIALSSSGKTVDVGKPVALFPTRLAGGPLPGIFRQQYDVSPDGQRFLMNVTTEDEITSPITLILNWKPKQ